MAKVSKRTRESMRQAGSIGGNTTKKRHPEHFEQIGKLSWESRVAKAGGKEAMSKRMSEIRKKGLAKKAIKKQSGIIKTLDKFFNQG